MFNYIITDIMTKTLTLQERFGDPIGSYAGEEHVGVADERGEPCEGCGMMPIDGHCKCDEKICKNCGFPITQLGDPMGCNCNLQSEAKGRKQPKCPVCHGTYAIYSDDTKKSLLCHDCGATFKIDGTLIKEAVDDTYNDNVMCKCGSENIRDMPDGTMACKDCHRTWMPVDDPPSVDEVSPPGGEKVVKALKKNKDVDNPWAVAWSMKNKGQI